MSQLKRFSNPAQLIRHIADETSTPTEDLWNQYHAQLEATDD